MEIFGDTPVGRLARSLDWSAHPLGPVPTWPLSLRTALSLALNSKFPMFVAWEKEGYFFYNDAYAVILGQKHPKAFGDRFNRVWAEIWNDILPFFESVHRGEPVYLENLRLVLNRYSHDEEAFFTFSYSPVRDGQQDVRGLFCAVVETTKGVLAERNLSLAHDQAEAARRELYDFFMQAPLPIIVLMGREHRYQLANPPYVKIAGRPLIGRTVREAFQSEEFKHFIDLLDEVWETNESQVGNELLLRLPDERGVIVELYLNTVYHPFLDADGTMKGILAFFQDVTEQVLARHRTERLNSDLRESLEARDDFLSIASHELKTPLTSLKLQSQLLRRQIAGDSRVPPQDQLEMFCSQTEKQVDRLVRLIDDMLDISRVRTGKLTIRRERLDLSRLVRDVIRRMEPQFTAAKLPFPHVEECTETIGEWDPLRIEQVIMNLLTNAIRYGERKPITVRVQSLTGRARLEVQDEGIGIAPESRELVFQIFKRASPLNAESGLGLGLYLSKQIVVAHGGQIWVESEPKNGSCFIVELPLTDSSGTAF
jgi:signal transduction histidine kinase